MALKSAIGDTPHPRRILKHIPVASTCTACCSRIAAVAGGRNRKSVKFAIIGY